MFNIPKVIITDTDMVYSQNHQDYDEVCRKIRFMNEQTSDSTHAYNQIIDQFKDMVVDYNNEKSWAYESNMIGMMFVSVCIKDKNMKFLIDTGAQVSCINEKHLDHVSGLSVDVGSSAGKFEAMHVIEMPKLQVLNMQVNNLPMLVIGKGQMSVSLFGQTIYDIDGILGWDLLRLIDFQIDFRDQSISLLEDYEDDLDQNLIESEFPSLIITDDQGMLKTFGIDTGARSSWLHMDVVKEEHLHVKMQKSQKNLTVHGVVNQVISIIERYGFYLQDKHVVFKNIKTGHTGLLNDSEFDGIIGHDMMRNRQVQFINSQRHFRIL